MKSKKELFKVLAELTGDLTFIMELKHPAISNETYGRKSCIYIYWDMIDKDFDRRNCEVTLAHKGFKINWDYGTWLGHLKDDSGSTSEVTVAYFKGHHWDE